MSKRAITVTLMALVMLLGVTMSCFAQSVVESNGEVEEQAILKGTKTTIKIFETTDMHGYIIDASSMNEETFQYRLAYLAGVVNKARGDYDDVILLNGGNNYEGTPVSNLLKGAAIRAAFTLMGYDGTAMGNHEFDWDNIKNRINADAEGTIGTYEVGSFVGDSDVPVLASNLYYKATGERVEFTKDYVIVDKAGYKVALIGYISDFSSQVMTSRIEEYTIDTSVDKLNALIATVNETEKPDVTIIVSFSDAKGLAEKVDPELVDVVVGGHSGSGAGIADNGVTYLQGSNYASGYACADIVIDDDTGEVTVENCENVSIVASGRGADNSHLYSTSTELDADVFALSQAAWEAVADDMNQNLGYITTSLSSRTKAEGDSNASVAGNWLTGLMLRWAQENGYPETVAAFYNNGGIRSSISISEGETQATVTAADVYSINPFCNYWYIYEVTAAELAQQIADALGNGNLGNEMSGITYTYTYSQSESVDERSGKTKTKTVIESIDSITLADGTALDLNDTTTKYLVCISNYSATLEGSVFIGKTPLNETSAPIDNETLIAQLLKEAGEGKEISVDTSARGTGTLKAE